MQIVIEIPDKVYGLLKYFEEVIKLVDEKEDDDVKTILIRAVVNGTPLTDTLDKIRDEIEQEYNRLSATRADETLELGECLGLKMSLKIIDTYKAESDHKCHTCNHYMSGEYDGSCDSYICEHYSGWESEG